jgi:membrane protein DedA with SNARE-associated domain
MSQEINERTHRQYYQSAEMVNRPSKKQRYLIGGAALVVILVLCVAAVVFSNDIGRAGHYGYLGIFIISIFAGGTVIVPVPGLLVVFTSGSLLHPAVVGVVAGAGEALGVVSIYLAGFAGRGTLHRVNNRFAVRFESWIRRHNLLAVFVMSAMTNPLFYPFALMAGMLRFGLPSFFISCWAGKTAKNTAVAYLGFFGLGSLLRWLGVLG